MEYVKASIQDCAELISLHKEINQECRFVPFLKEKREDSFRRMADFFQVMENPYLGVYLAKDCGKVIGNVWVGRCYEPEWSHRAFLGISVLKQYHRKGVGAGLLNLAKNWAQTQGCHRIGGKVVSANTPAIMFFLNQGFEFYGLEKESYCIEDVFFNECLFDMKLLKEVF